MRDQDNTITDNFAAILAQYESILPEPDRLLSTLKQPIDTCFWSNPLKITAQQCEDFLLAEEIPYKKLPWSDHAFSCPTEYRIGKHWLYLTGLIQIQEAVSMLPTQILEPKPTDCILDLCAAPGNKTAQCAVAMQNQGTLIANDKNYRRLKATGQIIKRLGIINASTTTYNGIRYPIETAIFDKILVDAPCSCEGTLRKSLNKKVSPNSSNSIRLAETQIALLKKAIAITKPGGKILYSTCTFAPEENECVINTMLKQYGHEIKLLPITIPNFIMHPGITQWRDQTLLAETALCRRVWPHFNNSGGFFLALIEKRTNPQLNQRKESMSQTRSQKLPDKINLICNDFNIQPRHLENLNFSAENRKGIYVTNSSNISFTEPQLSKLSYDVQGLFFLKTKIKFPKISTAAAMLWGHLASKNVVQLTREQLDLYLQQADTQITAEQRKNCSKTGYVIVKYGDIAVGVGILFARELTTDWPMRSLFPGYLR